MSVVGTPTALMNPTSVNGATGEGLGGLGPNGYVTEEAVRCFLLDYEANNILDGYTPKYTKKMIEQGVMASCSEYNTISPIGHRVKFDGSDWPKEAPHLLILGVASWLMRMTSSEQLRNQFNAQDGNIPRVGVFDKFPQYVEYSRMLQQDFRDGVSRIKKLRDLESSFSVTVSPMARRGGGWF